MAIDVPGHIKQLVQKYLQATITPEEEAELQAWYNSHPQDKTEWSNNETEPQLKERLFENIRAKMPELKTLPPRRRIGRVVVRAAAAAIVGVLLVSGYYWWQGSLQKNTSIAVQQVIDTIPVKYTRHITLPDGSTVILHANSVLEYPAAFSGAHREVSLRGEAYFDVAHDAAHPFIIQTGRVKTTVLGTAFNIKAYADSADITVAVTRGKVRVEDAHKILAELTPDQQVVYNTGSQKATRQSLAQAATVTEWLREDLMFDGESLGVIAEQLHKRYGVAIHFKNPAMKNCSIKAFFSGTETLEKIVERLTVISNASYIISEDGIVIDGAGCDRAF